MRMPPLESVIERRLLINYRVDADVLAAQLPAPFRPQLVGGFGVAGICMIRLGATRPRGVPAGLGLRSESAAHRMAVEWNTPAGVANGVYVPRRDSSSRLNVLLGGRLYPGEHGRADFSVAETPDRLQVAFRTRDRSAAVDADVELTEQLEGSELFGDLAAASAFFEAGSAGFSATRDAGRFDGLELSSTAWLVQPARVRSVRSSLFDDQAVFPAGSAVLDCALVMRGVPVSWQALPSVVAPPRSALRQPA